jgi:pimeloyl-ACP methyl ester carboxylesterase
MTGKCEECDHKIGCLSSIKPCHKCEKILCSKCSSSYPLIPFDRNTTNNDEANDLSKHNTVYPFCKKCFQEESVLDFSKGFDVVEPDTTGTGPQKDGKVMTFVFVHGGGASRALYSPYAEIMAQKGHRSILLDLPGHGTLAETPMTLDSCASTVQNILDGDPHLSKDNTIYVGGSLGAYTGFYTLDKLKDRFAGAVLIDCGQNVGPDCSYKAWFGLGFLRLVATNMSNMGMFSAMKSVIDKSPADWKIIESTFGAGMFFDSASGQVDCLHAVRPADHIANLNFPIIFFNGSEDHRDSEEKWLSLCQDQERSYLKVYEGGDHFFSHDSRFVSDLSDRLDKFAKDLSI